MTRIPFHRGLFYYAMIGLIGREPDRQVNLGWDGFYEFRYFPKNEKEVKSFQENSRILSQWLDNFDIVFSGSRCEYGKPFPTQLEDKDMLQIKISLQKDKS